MVKITSAFKHIASPHSTEKVLSNAAHNGIPTNVPVNRNTIYGRTFNDNFGLAGEAHATRAQDRFAIHRAQKNDITQARNTIAEQRKARMSDELKDDITAQNHLDRSIQSAEKDLRDKLDNHSLRRTVQGAAGDTFKAMNTGTASQVAAKWGALGAGAFMLNGAGRALTGGGVTYNATGERDIMGIPFV